ncbi:MAG: hypothetical protein Q8Q29_07505 [Actinomycetota bacterium]|nr:hypothetical protein [Actinomycetota bacterium]
MQQVIASVLLLVVFAAACGNEVVSTTQTPPTPSVSPTTSTTTSTMITTTSTNTGPTLPATADDLPPPGLAALATLFDPLVEPLGYRVGRATLIDRATYRATPDGRHLALYLTPLTAKTPDEYATDFLAIARTFVPVIFDHWPRLESFDVCQEPYDWEGATAPPGLTVFDIDRESVGAIDWQTVDLAGLLFAEGQLEGLEIFAQQEIRSAPVWQAAAGT